MLYIQLRKDVKNTMAYKCRITVATPTFNRAYIIENLYKSLQAQSFQDFEWLVIDDGSSDNTKELFGKWAHEENAFAIRYCPKENGGKHSAVNFALEQAEGELFFVMDSDDILTDDALEKIDRWFSELEKDESIAGITANKGTGTHDTPNAIFSSRYLDKSLLEMKTYRENGSLVLDGERAMVFYTDIHRKYPYPVFAGERFMTEAVVYNRMAADGYKMRFYNDIVCVYEYQPDGLTRTGSSLFLNNPKGYGLWLREKAKFEKMSWRNRLKMYYTFTCDLSGRLSVKEIADYIGAPYVVIGCMKLGHELVEFLRKCLVK